MSTGVLKKFYNSDEWKIFRQQIILSRRKNGKVVCENCGKNIVISKHIQVHHLEELTEDNYKDANISLNPNNVKVWCHICHNKHHKRFCGGGHKRKEKAVYIIYGPPMSGKSSYVIEHMELGDIVVDIDKLYAAVSFMDEYDKPDNLKYNVFSIRNHIIDNIRTRYGGFRTAWIVGGYANKVERERLANELGAKLILINATKEECINRLDTCNDYRQEHKDDWITYINKWFDEFIE
ncbi:MAG: HNH endonuclease [Clostridium sp.]|uniref:HNH endonuclease n=1 Tax=Clostridium sp. TaxID=1506 RepID=UPI001EB4F8BC|nr:HNH endonuclease [Clostridium sp.]MBS5886288.1 HNH endonuclease [Clostridium sp.]MDU7148319.1 HNH endonuclease [Clostridium sp.]